MKSEPRENTNIYTYFGGLTLLIYLATPTGYLVDIATSYMLKNQLHLDEVAVSNFRLITPIPVYIGFAFGLLRDVWNPFGLKDRGLLLIFGPICALVFVWLAFAKLTMLNLYIGVFAIMAFFRLVMGAYQGLLSLVGQEKLMPGRLTVVWQIAVSVISALAAWTSGVLTERANSTDIFLFLAGLCLAIGLIGMIKPASVFKGTYEKPQAKAASSFWADVSRLLKHKAIYPAVLVNFLWNFGPGMNTPLQYYLTNELHASDAVYANFLAIFALAFIPTFLAYGWLCQRFPLKRLLFWGTVIAVPQMIPLAFIHSGQAAEVLAFPIGLMGGVATGAYYDLAIRSCPAGLQGTLMLMVDGFFWLAARGSDRWGVNIYHSSKTNGFIYCVIATTAVYALILPAILLVPKQIMATADGEANPEFGGVEPVAVPA